MLICPFLSITAYLICCSLSRPWDRAAASTSSSLNTVMDHPSPMPLSTLTHDRWRSINNPSKTREVLLQEGEQDVHHLRHADYVPGWQCCPVTSCSSVCNGEKPGPQGLDKRSAVLFRCTFSPTRRSGKTQHERPESRLCWARVQTSEARSASQTFTP
jgi:hypothetical protein